MTIAVSRRHVLLSLMAGRLSTHRFAQTLLGQESNDDARRLVTPDIRQAIERGLKTLSRMQHQDGSFGSGNIYNHSIGVTALVGMAFLAAGHTPGNGPYGEAVERITDFLISKCDANGFIQEPNSRTHVSMYGHGFAVTYLAEVYGMTERKNLKPCLNRAIKLILSSQNKEGGWRYEPKPSDADVSVTVCQVMALRSGKNAGSLCAKRNHRPCRQLSQRESKLRRWVPLPKRAPARIRLRSLCRRIGGIKLCRYLRRRGDRKWLEISDAISPRYKWTEAFSDPTLSLRTLLRRPIYVALCWR